MGLQRSGHTICSYIGINQYNISWSNPYLRTVEYEFKGSFIRLLRYAKPHTKPMVQQKTQARA